MFSKQAIIHITPEVLCRVRDEVVELDNHRRRNRVDRDGWMGRVEQENQMGMAREEVMNAEVQRETARLRSV